MIVDLRKFLFPEKMTFVVFVLLGEGSVFSECFTFLIRLVLANIRCRILGWYSLTIASIVAEHVLSCVNFGSSTRKLKAFLR